jgi:hypothetical protein
MKTNLRNYKYVLFSTLVLSTIIPFAGINMAHATQSITDPYHIGTVADGTYNETAALKRVAQLLTISDEKEQEKQILYQKMKTSTVASDIEAMTNQVNDIQKQIDQNKQVIDAIQAENYKFYYVDPILREKYSLAANQFFNSTTTKYWKSKSFDDNKDAFPIVSSGLDSKTKMVEITLWKGIENSPKLQQYVSIIKEMMPNDVPWYISFGDYTTPFCADTRCSTFSTRIGGIDVDTNAGGGLLSTCTLGFKVTRNVDGAVGYVTAGHCNKGYTGNTVYQVYPNAIGQVSTTIFSNGADCDCSFVKLNAGISISDAIYNTPSTTYTPTSVVTQSFQAVGTIVKQSGITSGIQTGSINNNDITDVYSDGTQIFHSVKVTSMVASNGDSGAPITTNDGTKLYGELAGGQPGNIVFYTPENRVAADLGVTIVVG